MTVLVLDEPNVFVIQGDELAVEYRKQAREDFERQLEGTGFQMTPEALERWYGVRR